MSHSAFGMLAILLILLPISVHSSFEWTDKEDNGNEMRKVQTNEEEEELENEVGEEEEEEEEIEHQHLCKAIAFEGGGARGAFIAGVYSSIVENMDQEDRGYQIIMGVSVGSLSGLGLSLYPPTEEESAALLLLRLWDELKEDDVMEDWPWGYLEGIFSKSSFMNNAPLLELIRGVVEQSGVNELHRRLLIGLADSNTGDYFVFPGLQAASTDELTKMVLASTSMSAFFPPVVIERGTEESQQFQSIMQSRGVDLDLTNRDLVLIDPGYSLNMDLLTPVEECISLGYTEEEIVIDAVMTSPRILPTGDFESLTALEMVFRAMDINRFWVNNYYVEEAMNMHPDVYYRILFTPEEGLPQPTIALDFSHEVLNEEVEIGKEDGKALIEKYLEAKASGVKFSNFAFDFSS